MMSQESRINILATVKYYLPGYKSGGPLRSLYNMSIHLEKTFQFRIVTYDRDIGDLTKYQGIRVGDWNDIANSLVYYIPKGKWSILKWQKILSTTKYDVLYLNSFFSPQFTIAPLLLRRLGLIPNSQLIVAPRGEFSRGALDIKKWKKRIYIHLSRAFGLYNGVLWHASSEFEKKDIFRIMGKARNVHVAIRIASDLPSAPDLNDDVLSSIKKSSGSVRLVFLSRLSKMKNLDGALQMLVGIKGQIIFDIYGPVEDSSYWEECLKLMKRLPKNIHVTYRGAVPHDRVAETFKEYHFLYLPTRGENFGHVIYESLCAGLPGILSDQTPWRSLQASGIGWDLPLSRPEEFQAVLNQCVEMEESEYLAMSRRAFSFAKELDFLKIPIDQNIELFHNAISL